MDNENGEATDDGQQDTYNRALFQLVMTGFEPGDVPAMVQRAYLGDEAMPDWEAAPAATAGCTYCEGRSCDYHASPAEPPQVTAVLIPVRHTAIPAWRMALIEALAAWITRLS